MRERFEQAVANGWLLAGLFGALVYLVVAGLAPLDVTNVDWIYQKDDIATAQTGWTFYRAAPWSAQIAMNPTYGMDFAGSILYSDAVPLLAIPFKALSPLLPEQFQYFGLWTFASFILQGVFGWLLMGRATANPTARLLGACLLVLTPVYAHRLVASTHMSLTAHWLVLGALALSLPPHTRRPWLWWGLLVIGSAFVHAYLFVMVATLWLADLARRFWLARRDWRAARWPAAEMAGVGTLLIALVMGTGVWSGPAGEFQGGFSWFKMNVFSFFDPDPYSGAWPARDSWSFILPDLPNWGGDYEGFAFVGLGGLILGLAALWALPRFLRTQKLDFAYAPLAVALIGMAGFAVSQNVTFGEFNLWLWWPAPMQTLGELLRATGRFIWPFYYFLFFAGVAVLAQRFQARTLLAVLGGICVVQAVDLTPGWVRDAQYLRHDTAFPAPLTAQFWNEAGPRYGAIRLAPHWVQHPYFLYVAHVARAHGMSTDAAYLSRNSTEAQVASDARIEQATASGAWPEDTLFILSEDVAQRASGSLDRSRHFLARVDGLVVLAPNWEGCDDCGAEPFP